jgi:putative flavoprotein involved in K+ transport
MMKALRTGSDYCIDVGASDLIAAGEIEVRSGVQLRALKEHSVLLSNGSELPANLVVFATVSLTSPDMMAEVQE